MSNVAMFNSSGQFLQYITKRRAVSLLYAEEATPIKPTNEIWRSPSISIIIPMAVMLKGKANKFIQEEIAWSSGKMHERDNYTCQYCEKKLSYEEATVEHIVPVSRGGKNTWENCVTACKPCNNKKGNRTPEEAGMKLIKKPSRPKITDDSEIWSAIFSDEI